MTLSELEQIRKYLHRHPEVSSHEKETQKYVKSKLQQIGIEDIHEVGGTGLAVYFKGENPGKKILLRADMDALPIEEINDFEHRSIHPGVSHKCGHDGHTTIMLGVAARLYEKGIEKGEVALIFQPAEENGKGAYGVLNDPDYHFDADMAFALHNLPGYPLHQVVCKKGSFTAAAKSVILKLHGKTSHAAEPEKGINPGLAIAEILKLSEDLSVKEIESKHFRLITMVHVMMGEKSYGVSAGYGEVHLTLRTWRNDVMEGLEKRLMQQVKKICGKRNLQLEEEWLEIFEANENDEEAFEMIEFAAGSRGYDFHVREHPFKWGEDFGLFTKKFRGAMFGIGSGENTPALHNPDYDYPDAITGTGINMFMSILKKAL